MNEIKPGIRLYIWPNGQIVAACSTELSLEEYEKVRLDVEDAARQLSNRRLLIVGPRYEVIAVGEGRRP